VADVKPDSELGEHVPMETVRGKDAPRCVDGLMLRPREGEELFDVAAISTT
jgi:hypothetical protein